MILNLNSTNSKSPIRPENLIQKILIFWQFSKNFCSVNSSLLLNYIVFLFHRTHVTYYLSLGASLATPIKLPSGIRAK